MRTAVHTMDLLSIAVALSLGSPNVLGLQLPEILASTASGEGFWEF